MKSLSRAFGLVVGVDRVGQADALRVYGEGRRLLARGLWLHL